MIIKILGILDIFVGITFWLFGVFGIIPKNFILLIGIILLVKGLMFSIKPNITSILDVISAILIISSTSITLPFVIIFLVSLFLLQKGVFSLLS